LGGGFNLKKLIIDGVIGWDFTPSKARKFLDENNDEIQIDIASPGGFVYEGLEIFNLIRDYSRKKNKVTTHITGLAASMASYIALAGDKVTAEDNTVYMIHNVWSLSMGDYRTMQKDAKEIESLTNLLAQTYAKKTGKSISEIRKLMDDETFYYGEESKNNGFIDEIIKSENNQTNKDESIVFAQGRVRNMFDKMSESEKSKNDIQKAAALLVVNNNENTNNEIQNNNITVRNIEKPKTEEKKIMDLKEFQLNHSALYDQVFNLGVDSEKKRVNAHITIGKKAGAIDKALDFIGNGKSISDEEVQAEYLSAGIVNKMQNDRTDDNPENIQTATQENFDDKETQDYAKKMLARRGIK
jgi:ATP-dependent Clp endopeptidase proteolytic subunit ClpP